MKNTTKILILISILLLPLPAYPAGPLDSRLRDLSSVLDEIEGITTDVSGGKIVIKGEIYREEDFNVINRLTTQHRTVVNLTRVSPVLLRIRKEQLEGLSRSLGYPGFQIITHEDHLILRGTVRTAEEQKSLTKLFEEQSPLLSVILSVGNAVGSQLVVDLELYEINKNDLVRGGFIIPEGVTGSGGVSITNGALTHTLNATPLSDPVLHALKSAGGTRILANPRLTCQSGEEATFLAGGEIPISSINKEGFSSVMFKPYGVILEIKPTLGANNLITLSIKSEMSMVDYRYEKGSTPGFLIRRFSTSVTTQAGVPVLLSGILQQDAGNDISSIPGLGSIPILGELFKSREFREKQSHLVAILTARVQTTPDGAIEAGRVQKHRPFLEKPLWHPSSESQ
ncbi:MAG TPA: hypothetical protein VJL87_02340 [Bdellovibrionota bacterium]|nr:hypothetical protein [Bdellovibrionota bacterium]